MPFRSWYILKSNTKFYFAKIFSSSRKREERAKKANKLREERERAEREKQDKLQDRWMQKIADADRCKNLRKVEEVAKMQSKMEKMVSW